MHNWVVDLAMDAKILAAEMRTIHDTMNRHSPRIVEHLSIGPFDITINPAGGEAFPSNNRNRATALVGRPPTLGDIEQTITAFGSRGINPFFLWLGPGMDTPEVLASLEQFGLKEWPYVRYLVLARPAGNPTPARTTLEIVRVRPEQPRVKEQDIAGVYANEMAGRAYFSTLGLEGYSHFVAIDAGVVAAAALLFASGTVAYLGWSTTREEFRKRGAQSALIEARVRLAAELGCTVCVSETNTVAEASLRNLMRAGFEPAYALRVFGPQ